MRMRAASAPPAMPAYRATFMEAVGTQRLHLPADPTEPRRQGARRAGHPRRPSRGGPSSQPLAAPGASGRGHPATLPAGHPAEATDPPPRLPLQLVTFRPSSLRPLHPPVRAYGV